MHGTIPRLSVGTKEGHRGKQPKNLWIGDDLPGQFLSNSLIGEKYSVTEN